MSCVQGFSRFCGIDVGKNKHVACILDAEACFLAKPHGVGNDAAGYRQLVERLAQAGGPQQVLVGLEATGCYWYSLHEHLVRQGYRVVVLNPIQTAGQARKGIRKSQNDKIDARATETGETDWTPTGYPVEFYAVAGQGNGIPIRATMDSFGPLLLEPISFVMEWEMLRGIKRRAEASGPRP